MRVILLLVLIGIAMPAEAQRGKRPRDRILAEELSEYGNAFLTEVVERARPHFFLPEQSTMNMGVQTRWRVLVYMGQQLLGDSSILRHYQASEVKEIRYYKPNESSTRFGADNASVILLSPKEAPKKSG